MRKANTQANSKVPSKLDETAPRFTGDVIHGKAFVRLQMSCTTHIEFAYYGSSVGRLDLCAQCVSPDTTKDPELLKKFKIVLPVCKACIDRKKEIPKRNPKK
ncbi:uncharacterized protein LOC143079761 [Mytilus galloprovincialis]|uniref:uncharacterized protein LOC143079761 n=1 Tax=Mytilus galloprovincialis TaxID=29158 RepID=UPI003F7B72A4